MIALKNQTFEQARYERLTETVDEYLGGTGPEMGANYFLSDLKRALFSLQSYHDTVTSECTTVTDLLP